MGPTLIKSLAKEFILILQRHVPGELPVLLQLDTSLLLIFTAKLLQLMYPPAPHRGWLPPLGRAVLWPSLQMQKVLLSPQIKPVVSQYLKEKRLPYNEDTYGSRLQLFLQKYEELMVHAPPITELVGIQ